MKLFCIYVLISLKCDIIINPFYSHCPWEVLAGINSSIYLLSQNYRKKNIFSQPTVTVTLETEDNQETSPQMSRQSLLSLDKFQYLNAPKLEEIIIHDDCECMFRCLHHPLCVSVNVVAKGELWCELLSAYENSNPIEYKETKNLHHYHFLVRDYLHLLLKMIPCLHQVQMKIFPGPCLTWLARKIQMRREKYYSLTRG